MLEKEDWTILEHPGQEEIFLPALGWSTSWPHFWNNKGEEEERLNFYKFSLIWIRNWDFSFPYEYTDILSPFQNNNEKITVKQGF